MNGSQAKASHKKLELEYSEINSNFRTLTDIRFKLLGLLPSLGGVAVFALSKMGLPTTANGDEQIGNIFFVCLAACFGFVASLGLTIYDQRNSELYNALVHRATYLEKLFKSKNSPGAVRQRAFGGQFLERPKPHRVLFRAVAGDDKEIKIGHDLALAVIYGTVLGAWFFPISLSLLRLIGPLMHIEPMYSFPITGVIAVWMIMIFIVRLEKYDREDKERWHAAAKRDELKEK